MNKKYFSTRTIFIFYVPLTAVLLLIPMLTLYMDHRVKKEVYENTRYSYHDTFKQKITITNQDEEMVLVYRGEDMWRYHLQRGVTLTSEYSPGEYTLNVVYPHGDYKYDENSVHIKEHIKIEGDILVRCLIRGGDREAIESFDIGYATGKKVIVDGHEYVFRVKDIWLPYEGAPLPPLVEIVYTDGYIKLQQGESKSLSYKDPRYFLEFVDVIEKKDDSNPSTIDIKNKKLTKY